MQVDKIEDPRIMLGLLQSVERDSEQSQRRLAAEFGIALGLVNAYLKRCVKKGLVKVKEAPARRYRYYLTPKGFSEKSRLTVEYLSVSFSFFRRARGECAGVLAQAKQRGWGAIALAGVSDLAEIASLCALEAGIRIVAIVDAKSSQTHFVGMPVFPTFEAVPEAFDGVVITDLAAAQTAFDAAAKRFGADHVLAPELLDVSAAAASQEAAQ